MVDRFSKLPVDVFIYEITFLPFEEVKSICTSNSTLHSYCTDEKYKNSWKNIIDNTFGNIHNYQDKLQEIRQKLGLSDNTYNYLVYVHLIDLLDQITQLMIYRKQGDMDSFRSDKYNDKQRYLALFLLRDRDGMLQYSHATNLPYMDVLNGKTVSRIDINVMLFNMSVMGNIQGTKYFLDLGGEINVQQMIIIAINGRLNVIKYLMENYEQYNIPIYINNAFVNASLSGKLDIVKYLLEHGADIHYNSDAALKTASNNGRFEVVEYLVEHGANVTSGAILNAVNRGHVDVVEYLREHEG